MDQATRDSHWGDLNKSLLKCFESSDYSKCRDIKYQMFLQLLYEKRYSDSFVTLSEVFLFDLNGAQYPYLSERIIRCSKNLYPYIPCAKEQLKSIIVRRLEDVYTPYRTYTPVDAVNMFFLFAEGNRDEANALFYKNAPSKTGFLRYDEQRLKKSLEKQDQQLLEVQKAEAGYKNDGDLEKYVAFYEKIWATDGLKFYSMKWWFVLPDLYFKQNRFDEVIDFCEMIKLLDEYTIDKADKYILRAQQRKEKQLTKHIKTNV